MAKYKIKDGVGILPDKITKVENWAFRDCTDLTKVVIPDTVTEIGEGAFAGCTGLKSMVIPDSVTKIGEMAFSRCSGLTDIALGNSVQKIGRDAFQDCIGLVSIFIPASVGLLDWYGIFKGCVSLESIKVAEGNLFYDSRNDCNAIIETKKNKLVGGCAKTVIPDTVVEIGTLAFIDVNKAEIFIHEGIKSIEHMAFKLSGVNSIKVAEGNTVYDSRGDCNAVIETETNSLVLGCAKTLIPDSVTIIKSCAFYGCSDLAEIIIPTSVTVIDSSAFCKCKELSNVIIPDSVTEIASDAFERSGLKSVVIGKIVSYIGKNAFRCNSLETITFRGAVKEINEDAFNDCDSVKVINVPIGKSSIYARKMNKYNFPGLSWGAWEALFVELPAEKKVK